MDFPVEEYEGRLKAAHQWMHELQLDALLLMSEPDVRYFSGFRTQFWLSPTRPWYLVVPKSGGPIAIIPGIGAPTMNRTWIGDIRAWDSPAHVDDGISLLRDCLSGSSRIGMPMGRESVLRMPLADFERLKDELGNPDWVDVSVPLMKQRLIKSENEIETIAEICGIACNAFDAVPQILSVGQPLKEVFSVFKQQLLREGAEDVPYLVGGKGALGYDDVISPPDGSAIETGDVLMLDTGATLQGYYCDFDRNFCFGQPADVVEQAHEVLWQATQAGLEAARPGVTCRELFLAMHAVIEKAGIGDQSGSVGRYGHGLGMQLTEGPSLIDWDETKLEEGAVMTLEPSIGVAGGGMMVHEENIVIRDGDPQLLTRRAQQTLPRI